MQFFHNFLFLFWIYINGLLYSAKELHDYLFFVGFALDGGGFQNTDLYVYIFFIQYILHPKFLCPSGLVNNGIYHPTFV